MGEALLIGLSVVVGLFLIILIASLIFGVITGEVKFTKKCFGVSFKEDRRSYGEIYDVWWSFLWIGTNLYEYVHYDDTHHYTHKDIHFKKDKALPLLYLKKYKPKKFDRMRGR